MFLLLLLGCCWRAGNITITALYTPIMMHQSSFVILC
jgi:hypothetical protein